MAAEPASRRRVAALLAGALVATLLAAAPARAQTPSPAIETTRDGLTVSLVSPWPSSVGRGWAPVRLEVRNASERTRDLEFALSCGWGRRTSQLRTALTLAPGASQRLDLLLPLIGADLTQCSLEVSGDVERNLHLPVGSVPAEDAPFHLLVVTSDADQGSRGTVSSLVASIAALTAAYPVSGGIEMSTGRGRPTSAHPCVATYVAPRDLPLDPLAYTSIEGVVVDWESVELDRDALAALLTWVRLGGRAWFIGDGPGLVDRLPGVAEWDEERFVIEEGRDWRILRHGVGRLLLADNRQLLDPDRVTTVVPFFSTLAKSIPLVGQWDPSEWPAVAKLLDIGAITARGGAIALLCFVIVIGPVNLFVVGRRRRKPILLLITTPLLSIGASLLFLAYGVFRQGLDIKVASQSVTLLDQRSHRAVTIERRELFAGFVGGRGLRPAAGTSVSPHPVLSGELPYYARSEQRNESFAVELGAERLLGGSFLPPREEARQLLYSEAAARQRVELRKEDGHLVAVNGFGVAIEQLVVCDAAGKLHRCGAIEAGGAAALEPIAKPSQPDGQLGELWRDAAQALPAQPYQLPLLAGTYAAHLEASPFADATGLELTHQNGRHAVVGILDLAGEEWR